MFFTKRASFALMAGVVGSIGGLLFGYDLGVISGALSSLSQRFSLSILQQEFVTSVLYLGCVVGSLFGGFVCDYVGRKRCVFLICILFISASLILFFANGMAMLIFGRFLVGIGVAISAIADVAYLTEISPIEYRGALVSCNELMITVGLLLAFVIDYVFDSVHDGWRFMLGFPIVLSSIWMFLMSFMPESPRWLLVQDRCDDAYSVFLDICNSPEEASTEFQQAKDNINALSSSGSSLKSEDNSLWSIVLNWKLSLLVSIFLMTLQNFSGQSAILTYSATFFEIAGFGSRASLFASVVLGVVKVVSTIFSLFAVDKCGRKRLLLYGILGMILSLFCVIMILYFGTNGATIRLDSSTHLSTVSAMLLLICICTFVAFYAIGFGPITWLLSSELFSDEIRGRTLGIATLSNWIASLIVVSSFLSCVQSFGFLGTLTMYWVRLKIEHVQYTILPFISFLLQ